MDIFSPYSQYHLSRMLEQTAESPKILPMNKTKRKSKCTIDLLKYQLIGVYNFNRIPQWINEATCLCTGCINPRTGKEDRNYISSPLKTSLRVLRKTGFIKSFSACNNKLCTNSFEEFTIGCHCLVPSIGS